MKRKRTANENVPSTAGVRATTMDSRVNNKRGGTTPRQGGRTAVQATSSHSSHSQSRVSTRRATAAAAATATATQGSKTS